MTNLYHVLSFAPALEKENMYVELEKMAQTIVNSGKLRIDANDKINFARFSLPYDRVSMMFSKRELTDAELLPKTKQILKFIFSRKYGGVNLDGKVKSEIARLKLEIKKYQPVTEELELKIARILVQAAHPIVIKMLIFEGVEIFVSYSYNIGDMLDIISWQEAGSNSGMQSTDGRKCTIFVSAGGNPFAETEEGSIYGDGFAAIARMIVIAAQEIGHYSDIMRNDKGVQISRHSADFGGRRAKENVRLARLNDVYMVSVIKNYLVKCGLQKLEEYERHLKFFKKTKRSGFIVLYTKFKSLFYKEIFLRRARKKYQKFIKNIGNEKYIASKIIALLEDMAFNLTPKADVYSRANKTEEEAIACIEALARVPQQAAKWGHPITKITMFNLYEIYYNQVIPSCVIAYEDMTGIKFDAKLTKKIRNPIIFFKALFKKKDKKFFIWNY